MLWTGHGAAISASFKELLLELAQERSLEDLLPLITRRLAEHEDVALARLWLMQPGDQCGGCAHAAVCADQSRCLHLVASAARPRGGAPEVHTRLNGAFRRIPIGAFKVGQVAAGRVPVLVRDPLHDVKIRRPEWVRAEGIVGFAGLPLACRGELLGVLGVFVRAPITDAAVDVLRIIANHAGAAIATARAFDQVERMRVSLQAENDRLRQRAHATALQDLVGDSPPMQAVQRQIAAVAPTDASVLVLGESGTGKELVAHAIARLSRRAEGPFVGVNCAAIPRELAESELFGHVKGAFSGAVRDRVGRFEAAHGGTLFLDELGELPLELQGKLLRVLQEGTYERVGEVKPRRTDVRIVAATNRDLAAEVAAGRFRQDLYYRLAVFPIALPPLRARKEDLPALTRHLLARICQRLGCPPLVLSADDVAALAQREWPGNVRELINVLERTAISRATSDLATDELAPLRSPIAAHAAPLFHEVGASPNDWARSLEGPAPSAHEAGDGVVLSEREMRWRERENLRRALERCQGKIYGADGAAALLGIKPTTLTSRLKRSGLPFASRP